MLKLCEERWSWRSKQVKKFLIRPDCILDTFLLFENDPNAKTSLSAAATLLRQQFKQKC